MIFGHKKYDCSRDIVFRVVPRSFGLLPSNPDYCQRPWNLHSIMIVLLRQLIPREAKTTPILYGDSCFSKINPKSSLSFTKSCFFTKFQQPKLWISRSVIIQLVSINLQFIFLQYLVILYWNDQQNKKDVFRLIINNVRSINPLLGLRVKLLMIL